MKNNLKVVVSRLFIVPLSVLRQRYFDIHNDESENELSIGTGKGNYRRGHECLDVVFADDCCDYGNPNGGTMYDTKGFGCKNALFATVCLQSIKRTREFVIGNFMQN